jgi:hypothetical protein
MMPLPQGLAWGSFGRVSLTDEQFKAPGAGDAHRQQVELLVDV